MKQLFIAILLLGAVSFNSAAQESTCKDDCEYGPLQTYNQVLCKARDLNGDFHPAVFIGIIYREERCNGQTALKLFSMFVLDDRNWWDTATIIYGGGAGLFGECLVPRPLSQTHINQMLNNVVEELLDSMGVSTSIDVTFPGSCRSEFHVRFPQDVFMESLTGESGAIRLLPVSRYADIYQSLPCTELCCKITYDMRIDSVNNGYTYNTWHPGAITGEDQECIGSQIPDYSTYPLRITGYVPNQSGGYDEIKANVVSNTPCEFTCLKMRVAGPFNSMSGFTTDVDKTEQKELTLQVNPTLFSNYIRFNSSRQVEQIVIYDITGSKVYSQTKPQNGELNTSGFKSGIYYIQVHLYGGIVNTIKVQKQ